MMFSIILAISPPIPIRFGHSRAHFVGDGYRNLYPYPYPHLPYPQPVTITTGVLTIDLSSVDDEDGEDRVTDAAKDPCAFLEIWYDFFSSFAEKLC